MNDAVDRVIVERELMDRGFSRSLWLSLVGHFVLVGAAVAAPLLAPSKPLLRVVQGIVVPLPPGGGGPSQTEPPASAPPARPQPEPTPPPAPPKPDPKQIVKPPQPTQPPVKQGLPDPDAARKRQPRATPTPQPQRAQPGASGSSTGATSATPGLDITAPPGPGVPGGTDASGDWYLAGVQRKIWTLWHQQIRAGPQSAVAVRFTILADGSVTDVELAQSSGVYLMDQAAQRAIFSAAPFAPLPEHYGTDRFTITAQFKPLG